jgi:beta-lactamase superfamily II metal-dependent hydrolase
MPCLYEAYAARSETPVYKKATGRSLANKILMGTWVGVFEEKGSRARVTTAGPNGWVEKDDLRKDMGMKLFFIDVGQGDGHLIETPKKRVLVDGGPNRNVRAYLRGWQYKWLIRAKKRVLIDAVFVSHFDADHYSGLTGVIDDPDFEFGTVYHNGIARFVTNPKKRPADYDEDLGTTDALGKPGVRPKVLKTTFSTLADAKKLIKKGGLQTTFRKFLQACIDANAAGRLKGMKALTVHSSAPSGFSSPGGLRIEVLGPVPVSATGKPAFKWFTDSSHTRNGHSLVLKLSYGERTMLLGGDLNTESENHLMKHHGSANPFKVDVAKSCHHGSSDFTVKFMKKVNPYSTVISSGDNENYAHPRADAVGCAGRYSRGTRPIVFSTELARSIDSGGKILYGMINCRTDGGRVVLAQMKESKRGADIWDSYEI